MGGTALVSRGFQSSTQGIGRLIVLKIFKPDYLSSVQLTSQDFKKQIQPVLGLNHPNIVQLFDTGRRAAASLISPWSTFMQEFASNRHGAG